MNIENKNQVESEKNQNKDSNDRVNETGKFLVQSHLKVFDPESGDVFIFSKG